MLMEVPMTEAQQEVRSDLHICGELPLAQTQKLGKGEETLERPVPRRSVGTGTRLAMRSIAKIARRSRPNDSDTTSLAARSKIFQGRVGLRVAEVADCTTFSS
jgi:hypothetical protein